MKKFAANYIFDGFDFVRNGILTVTDEGSVISLSEFNSNENYDNLEFINGILCPGFVNAHCHLELSFLKGKFPFKLGMEAFIEQMKIIDRTITDEKEQYALLSDKEMWDEGISACADIVNSALTINIKKKSKIYYHNFIELFSLDEALSESVFKSGLALYDKFKGYARSITYHAPYSVSLSLHQKISDFNHANGQIVSVHSFEAKNESQLFHKWQSRKWEHDKNSTLTFLKKIPKNNKVLFVHNTYIDETTFEELKYFFNKRAWVICPSSNIFIENSLPPLNILLKDKENICIGTDSYASNSQLSILNEIKILSKNFPDIDLKGWLKMATSQGAKALNIQDKYGVFKKGAEPGVVALMKLDLSNLKLTDQTYVKRLI